MVHANLIKLMLALLAVFQMGDVVSTNHVLTSRADAIEGNPIMALLMSNVGGHWWIPKAIAAFLLIGAAWAMQRPAEWLHLPSGFPVNFYAFLLLNDFRH